MFWTRPVNQEGLNNLIFSTGFQILKIYFF